MKQLFTVFLVLTSIIASAQDVPNGEIPYKCQNSVLTKELGESRPVQVQVNYAYESVNYVPRICNTNDKHCLRQSTSAYHNSFQCNPKSQIYYLDGKAAGFSQICRELGKEIGQEGVKCGTNSLSLLRSGNPKPQCTPALFETNFKLYQQLTEEDLAPLRCQALIRCQMGTLTKKARKLAVKWQRYLKCQ